MARSGEARAPWPRARAWLGLVAAILESTCLPAAAGAGTPGAGLRGAGAPPAGTAVAQVTAPGTPAGSPRFRYDEASGRCLDADGREGYNPASREVLVKSHEAECADFQSSRPNMTYLRLVRANLRGAKLEGTLFYLGSITDSDLTGADLSGTSGQMDYSGSRLRRARLAGADLSWADLRSADLEGADLRDARFSDHTQLPFDHDEARRRGMVYVPKP